MPRLFKLLFYPISREYNQCNDNNGAAYNNSLHNARGKQFIHNDSILGFLFYIYFSGHQFGQHGVAQGGKGLIFSDIIFYLL